MQFKKVVSGLLLTCLIGSTPTALACGPFFPDATFVQVVHPDMPFKFYAAGNLGIVRPSYARSYLTVAYRYLNNKPLTSTEQAGAVLLWLFRLQIASGSGFDGGDAEIDLWRKARKNVINTADPCNIYSYRSVGDPEKSYDSYLNCPSDAFKTAIKTLNARVASFGATSPVVKDWIAAQDLVFCHCADPTYDFQTNKRAAEAALPQPAKADAPPIVKADRAYQIAASNFYEQKFDTAITDFQQIAADAASPWSTIANYMVARAFVRKGTLASPADLNALRKADTQVEAILANPKMAEFQQDARALSNFIQLRLNPPGHLKKLAAALQDSSQASNYKDNLYDYTQLYDNLMGISSDEPVHLEYDKVPQSLRSDDLSDWISTYQSTGGGATQHAITKYKETKSEPWLIASLDKLTPKDAFATEAIAAAQAVPTSSPAALTAYYLAAKLLAQQGKKDASQSFLTKALSIKNLPPSAKNMLLNEKSQFCTTFNEFLQLSVRTPSSIGTIEDGEDLPAEPATVEASSRFPEPAGLMLPASADVFNSKMPLSYLVQAAKSQLPSAVKTDLTQSAWVKAFLLDDIATLKEVTPLLSAARPGMASLLNTYQSASGVDKKFAGVLVILKNPGLEPFIEGGVLRETPVNTLDDYSDNWWCADPSIQGTANAAEYRNPSPATPFLTASQQQQAKTELAKIKALGAGPTFLTSQVVEYGKTHLGDQRVPEALAGSVKATKLGCKDNQTTKFSKQAHNLLHSKFPNNTWTKKTPYWY